MKHRIYIASPFFNPEQIEAVSRLEDLFTATRLDFYSPRLSDASLKYKGRKLNTSEAQEIFENNVEAMNGCTMMLAVVDWLTESNTVITRVNKSQGIWNIIDGENINIPDSGTVWEMGYAYFKGLPAYGFTTSSENTVNLMLAESCFGFIKGWESLNEFVKIISGWQGERI